MIKRLLRRFLPVPGARPRVEVGDPAPEWSARTATGEDVTSAQLEGQRYVLWFYPMADTPG